MYNFTLITILAVWKSSRRFLFKEEKML